jgi:L-arabinokinase
MQISSMLMCLNFGNRWLMIEEVGDGWQSHYSYSKCRLGSHGTDRLVSLVKQTRNQAYTKGTSLFGAKITGGGCGGTVCVLGRTGATSQNQILQVMMALKHFKVCLRE